MAHRRRHIAPRRYSSKPDSRSRRWDSSAGRSPGSVREPRTRTRTRPTDHDTNRAERKGNTMPEGDTIHRAAATLQRAIGGQVVTRFESVLPKLNRVDADTPLARTDRRARRSPRQAPADLVLWRSRAADAYAHERVVAHLPSGRALAAAASRHAHRHRDGQDARRRVQRAGCRVRDRDRTVRQHVCRGSSDQIRCQTTSAEEAIERMQARGDTEIADVAARSMRHRRHRQRLQVRSPVRRRVNPFTPAATTREHVAEIVAVATRFMRECSSGFSRPRMRECVPADP